MSVKLGIAPIAWSNDDMPELGGDTSLEQCLSEASDKHCSRDVSPPNSGISSLLHAIGAIPNFTDIQNLLKIKNIFK